MSYEDGDIVVVQLPQDSFLGAYVSSRHVLCGCVQISPRRRESATNGNGDLVPWVERLTVHGEYYFGDLEGRTMAQVFKVNPRKVATFRDHFKDALMEVLTSSAAPPNSEQIYQAFEDGGQIPWNIALEMSLVASAQDHGLSLGEIVYVKYLIFKND